jgi:hypothetical protein
MVGIYHLYKRKQRKGRFTSCRCGKKKSKPKNIYSIIENANKVFFHSQKSYNYEE